MTNSTIINSAINNNLVDVEVTRLINGQDCQYGVCYHIHHTGNGIRAEVNALIEAENLGLIPSQGDRDRSNDSVWSQVQLSFHEEVMETSLPVASAAGATAFQPSKNVRINLPISAKLAEKIGVSAKNVLRDKLITGGLHKASDVETIMWKLGINTRDGMDYLIAGESDGEGRWLTVAGECLVKHCRTYDYSDHRVGRLAAAGQPGEILVDFGGAHLQWVGLAPASRKLPDLVAEYLHVFVSRHYDTWAKEVLDAQKASQRAWGKEKNDELLALGLSKAEIRGWWSLSWKKEWSAERWVEFCQAYSNLQLAAGLAADRSGNRTGYFKAIGIRLEGTIPRTQDAVESLAKAKGLKSQYVRNWRKDGILVDAVEASVDASGARTWSF